MQSKLKPGQTFDATVDGDVYVIEVLSVCDKLDAEDKLNEARDAGTTSAHYRAWLEIVEKHVKADGLRDKLTADTLGDLMEAVLRGNEPSEAELKN